MTRLSHCVPALNPDKIVPLVPRSLYAKSTSKEELHYDLLQFETDRLSRLSFALYSRVKDILHES
jgi:hypothetical protein